MALMQPAARADLSRTWAVVPIRGLETAKTRLGEELDAEERLDLVTDLLRRTLRATRDARRITGAIVVTMDPAAAGIAKRHRAVGLVERAPGLNEAITAAGSVATARGATAILVLPADLPAITAAAVDDVVDAASVSKGARDSSAAAGAQPEALLGEPPGLVVIVPDRHGSGTNVLLVSPPRLIEPQFGAGSLDRHRAAARSAGARVVELGGPLSLDVDTSDDLVAAESALGAMHG
jgi:2-phospho-L-lactate guanylyltransferase